MARAICGGITLNYRMPAIHTTTEAAQQSLAYRYIYGPAGASTRTVPVRIRTYLKEWVVNLGLHAP